MILKFNELEWIQRFFNNGFKFKRKGIDRVRNFLLLWSLFEKYACNKSANIESISEFVDKLTNREKIDIWLINNHIDYFSKRYFNADGSQKAIFDGLRFSNTSTVNRVKQKVVETLTNKQSDSNENLKSLLFILYRFRNNLFHGEKEITKLNGQTENFKVANDLLAKILTLMKKHYMIIDYD